MLITKKRYDWRSGRRPRKDDFSPSVLRSGDPWTLKINHVSLPALNSPITFLVSTMEPAEFDDDANANGDGNGDSSSGVHAAACTSRNAESVFISKNSSLKALAVLSAGLKNDDGTDLIDLEGEPWKSLPVTTIRPQRVDYAEEISRRYESENLSVTTNMTRAPKPKQWDKTRMPSWLDNHPLSHPTDVQFLQETVQIENKQQNGSMRRGN